MTTASYNRFLLQLLAAVLCLLLLPTATQAAGPWAEHELVRARLISAITATGTASSVPVGLELDVKPGWKTYWRSPGDAGFPPSIDFAAQPGVAAADMRYPAPQRFSLFGLETFGYHDTVVFPTTLTLQTPGTALSLRPHLDVLVCEEICVPVSLDLALDLPAGAAKPSDEAQMLARWAARVPVAPAAAGLQLDAITTDAPDAADGGAVVVSVSAQTPLTAPDAVIEAPPGWSFGAPALRFADARHSATLTLPITQRPEPQARLDGTVVTVTIVDDARAVETTATVAKANPGTSAGQWLAMLLTALAGGLILNIMPCVLPVLSLKLLSATRLGMAGNAAVRVGFLATAAGVLAAFLALGGTLAALKSAGVAVGWGIQFQQPLFLVAMIIVLTLFGAALLDLLTIALPSRLSTALGTAGGSGLGGQFFTGVFATLLATPCSAPLVGTAVGFALARGTSEILAIFAALGFGLALPYLLVSAVPSAARLVPRPGRWLVWIKAAMGLALLGTGVWLLFVVAAQIGGRTTLAIGGLMITLLALQVARRMSQSLRSWHWAGTALAIVGALALPIIGGEAPAPTSAAATRGYWQPFERARISTLVAAGQVVVVEVTADWCVTCIVNERGVLTSTAITRALTGASVTPMLADWTRPDPDILAYLADHGRYGIPFTAIYGPAAPNGILLPEVLSIQGMLEALQAASGQSPDLAG
jgi:suppressor for copper-sensitivity B